MEQLALYRFRFDCGRMGSLGGLFIARPSVVAALIGCEIYFGEVLGKHSEITGPVEEGDLELLEVTQDTIDDLRKACGDGGFPDLEYMTISGHNPLDYREEEEV
jgi:hypothetical protein